MSGANDMGVDVAEFTDDAGFGGVWDNYQCKHYDDPLTPSIAVPEIGKALWHSFKKHFVMPQKYYFVAPKECGMSLRKLLLNPPDLKAKLLEKWDDWCAEAITATEMINLEGEFLAYVEATDFSSSPSRPPWKSSTSTVTPHIMLRDWRWPARSPWRAIPPAEPASSESRYLQQLFEAYGDHQHVVLASLDDLYHGKTSSITIIDNASSSTTPESLRNFARDTVPSGTFEDLQDEVHAGVVEVEAASHADGLERLNAVTQAAAQLPLSASGLISVTKIQDKRGICHQLANQDRLTWKK